MTTHHVKCWPDYFKSIVRGEKTFDLRKNDRGYEIGDDVVFEEYRPGVGEYTGATTARRIVYVLREFEGLQPGYCILGLIRLNRHLRVHEQERRQQVA